MESAPDLSEAACLALPGALPAGAQLDTFISRLKSMSARRVRWGFTWAAVERQKGVLDFAPHDGLVSGLADADIEQTLFLGYGNPLYSAAGAAAGGDETYPPDDASEFGRYSAALVARYGARVKRWEVWNEPNAGIRFFKPQTNPTAYAALLQAAAAGVRQACADCEVLFGGTVSIAYPNAGVPSGGDFIRSVLAAGGTDFDAVAVHLYMLYPPCSPPEGGPNACAYWEGRAEVSFETQISEVVSAGGDKPFDVTEMGWPTFTPVSGKGAVTEDAQASWLVRGALLGAAKGARSLCWFTLEDEAVSSNSLPEGDFGLYRYGGAEKRSLRAFGELFGTTNAGRFIRDRGEELGLLRREHALLFGGSDRLVTFLWREESAKPRTVRVRLFGPTKAMRPGRGEAEVAIDGGFAEVQLEPEPIALVSTRP
ncbi:MAG: hypothetical protein HYZ28_07920 [Myxococcales bacterium]|nr:hypothetical protein [Myxococcales bacterium]